MNFKNIDIPLARKTAWVILILGSFTTLFGIGQLIVDINSGYLAGILIDIVLISPLIISILVLVYLKPKVIPTINEENAANPPQPLPKKNSVASKIVLILLAGFAITVLLAFIAMVGGN